MRRCFFFPAVFVEMRRTRLSLSSSVRSACLQIAACDGKEREEKAKAAKLERERAAFPPFFLSFFEVSTPPGLNLPVSSLSPLPLFLPLKKLSSRPLRPARRAPRPRARHHGLCALGALRADLPPRQLRLRPGWCLVIFRFFFSSRPRR